MYGQDFRILSGYYMVYILKGNSQIIRKLNFLFNFYNVNKSDFVFLYYVYIVI